MIYRIEQSFTPELVKQLIRLYGKELRVISKLNHDVVYIDTPKNTRVIFADKWNMKRDELSAFIDMIERADSRRPYPFHTPSSFAMAFWRRNYGAEERNFVPNDGFRFELMREAVYGGRCEAYKIGGKTLAKYDINSSYPYHASKALLSIPGSLDYVTNGSIRNIANHQGMSRIRYSQNEDIPAMPNRINGRIFYANGEDLVGTYTHSEIRYALENGLITDVKVLKQYVASEYDNPLHDFMRDCYDNRKENKIWKMIANSLIGRLCAVSDGIIQFRPATNNDARPENSGLIMKLFNDRMPFPLYLYGVEQKTLIKNNPLWAAEIYSLARITLYDAMISADDLWYCDTDCIIASSNRNLAIGTELGEWKYAEAPIQVYGAKQYKQGSEVVWKGVPFDSPKRAQIQYSAYTQERLLCEGGETRPYSTREAEKVIAAHHVQNKYMRERGKWKK